jgi:hypothetical protein
MAVTLTDIEAYIKTEFLKDEAMFKTEFNKLVAWVEGKSVTPMVVPPVVVAPVVVVPIVSQNPVPDVKGDPVAPIVSQN